MKIVAIVIIEMKDVRIVEECASEESVIAWCKVATMNDCWIRVIRNTSNGIVIENR